MMDVRQLNVLLAVAEYQSFSAAAQALHTVQSNVSAHISRLEQEAGATLIDRARRCLTPEGQVVADRARRIQLELQAISDDLASMRANLPGTVTVGGIGTTARWIVPLLLYEADRLHPGREVIIAGLAMAPVRDRHKVFIIDEFPDMLLNLSRKDEGLLREFLAWFRTQRQNPAPAKDSIRWLVGGSVNLAGTLDAFGLVDRINDLEDISLPLLTDGDIETFVTEMLGGRDVPLDDDVPQRLIARLGRPIPFFMQMATQDLYRLWKREQRKIVAADVDTVFDAMVVGSAARTRLQHFHSRIRQYYADPKGSIAYALLGQISVSDSGLRRATLLQETERLLVDLGVTLPAHERSQMFNQLLLDLENDFYIVEGEEEFYDFASGVLKSWWRKYHA